MWLWLKIHGFQSVSGVLRLHLKILQVSYHAKFNSFQAWAKSYSSSILFQLFWHSTPVSIYKQTFCRFLRKKRTSQAVGCVIFSCSEDNKRKKKHGDSIKSKLANIEMKPNLGQTLTTGFSLSFVDSKKNLGNKEKLANLG